MTCPMSILVTGQASGHCSGGQEWDLTTTQHWRLQLHRQDRQTSGVGISPVRASVQNMVYHKVRPKLELRNKKIWHHCAVNFEESDYDIIILFCIG